MIFVVVKSRDNSIFYTATESALETHFATQKVWKLQGIIMAMTMMKEKDLLKNKANEFLILLSGINITSESHWFFATLYIYHGVVKEEQGQVWQTMA